jgi:hypothetical protein
MADPEVASPSGVWLVDVRSLTHAPARPLGRSHISSAYGLAENLLAAYGQWL